jgi:hypothetical protein
VQARLSELLPVPYYHVVFTLPHLLNSLALYNKEVIYEIFYQAVATTVITSVGTAGIWEHCWVYGGVMPETR